MRKRVRQQCEEMLANLPAAHNMAASCAANGEIVMMQQVLEACQQTAITLGELIESSEGEGTEVVAELERYCELLYRIHQGGEGTIAELDEYVERAEQLLENLPITREVVFLPYKVSMWDSLEQAWRKECEREDTHAVVIPIPYFEKNPDGSAKEFVYEGDKYPEDVPVVRYDAYDLEAMHPDAIYIHNPYDDRNIVTTVHPDYYTDKLKQYTDDLVYIPYYVLEDPNLNDAAGMELLSHYILVPGVLNANHIQLQSEAMRDAYLQVLGSRYGEDVRKHYEKAISVVEPSKVYRVKHPRPEDLELPEAWKTMVERDDGSRKKIIFYNTSVGTMTNYEKEYLDKIRRVMEIFYENREDVVLLWRPHPLMQATIDAMEPELKKEYEQLVLQYREAGWGIYDDSPEMYRAIQLSDAYYGDPSSVLELYKITKKPIMIENVDI